MHSLVDSSMCCHGGLNPNFGISVWCSNQPRYLVRAHCTIVLICIFLIASEVEHLFIYLLAICMSSWERCLFRYYPHFLIGLFLWCWIVWVLYIFLRLTHCWNCFLQISSLIHLVAFLFCWWLPWLCRSFLVWYSPIHSFLPLLPLPLRTNS